MQRTAGLFGKVPTAGDFVARNLDRARRNALDRWITRMLLPVARDLDVWPDGGLRAIIDGPAGAELLLLLPSEDTVGRRYPVCAVAPSDGIGRTGADAWCEGVLDGLTEARNGQIGVAELAEGIAASALPETGGDVLVPTLVWSRDSDAAPGPEDVFAAISSE